MSTTRMESASFDELKRLKIELRRKGRKDGVMYANVCAVMRRRFGRD